ncbi:MAG: tetratricopeptide repeat protein [Verrucomicrobiales bacterium]
MIAQAIALIGAVTLSESLPLDPPKPDAPPALARAFESYQKRDFVEAQKAFSELAEDGSAEAAFALGVLAQRGLGTEKSEAEALKWYRLAADAGHRAAQVNAGMMLLSKEPPDPDGLKQIQSAADAGYAPALTRIAEFHLAGKHVLNPDSSLARDLLVEAANGGDAKAAVQAASLYEGAVPGLEPDLKAAFAMLNRGADLGSEVALLRLGDAYERGAAPIPIPERPPGSTSARRIPPGRGFASARCWRKAGGSPPIRRARSSNTAPLRRWVRRWGFTSSATATIRESACPRTTPKRSSGIGRARTPGLRSAPTTSASFTKAGAASPKTMPPPSAGSAKPPKRGCRSPKTSSDPGSSRARARRRTSPGRSSGSAARRTLAL